MQIVQIFYRQTHTISFQYITVYRGKGMNEFNICHSDVQKHVCEIQDYIKKILIYFGLYLENCWKSIFTCVSILFVLHYILMHFIMRIQFRDIQCGSKLIEYFTS